MISFIEKEKYYEDSLFTGHYYYYPNYMVKDGKEFFLFDRREPDDEWRLEANEARKYQLIKNQGKYFKFNGFYDNPLDMFKEIIERKHHFTKPDKMYCADLDKYGYLDFLGNRDEVSDSFYYRIYDNELAHTIQKIVKYINDEKWIEAKQLVN